MADKPQAIAERGEKIYAEKYKDTYEKQFLGQFVAIDIDSGESFVAKTPEQAISAAQAAKDGGFFHLIRIGAPGTYRVGYYAGGRGIT
jgi:hypothetical protein